MTERELTCCFSGHRPQRLPWGAGESDERCSALKNEISAKLEEIYSLGYRHFICGMAIGCDMFFAEAVLELKKTKPGITLEAAVPCASQPDRWNRKQKARYEELLSSCDTVTVLQQEYTKDCMMRRNKYMVDRSSLLLACFDGSPSGTMNTIVYAGREDVPSIIIDI